MKTINELETNLKQQQLELEALKKGVNLSDNLEIRDLQVRLSWLTGIVLKWADNCRGNPY